MNHLTRFVKAIAVLIAISLSIGVSFAQTRIVRGTVTDESGNPLPGAGVLESGTRNGVVTDVNGKYEIQADSNGSLEFSYIGMNTKQIAIDGLEVINVSLESSANILEDVVVVAYGVQKKATLTGSVASIGNQEVINTKNTNTENMLTGKIAGVRVVQSTSEPGTFTNEISIRNFGTPLIIIDGVPRSTIGRLDANDIESISVIKDAAAAVYGVKAANGVLIITTKKGTKGKMHVTYDFNCNLSTLTGLPRPLDAVQFMTLKNEQSMRNYDSQLHYYSDEEIYAYTSGAKQTTDWYHAVVREITPSYQHSISASGGTEKIQYYMSLGFKDNEGFYKNGNLTYKQYNFRSNISAEPVKGLTLSINLWGDLDTKTEPREGAGSIIKSLWRQYPTDPIYANNNENYYFRPSIDGYNPVAFADMDYIGYNKSENKYLQSQFSAEFKPSWVPGLSVKAMLSYDTSIRDGKRYQKAYNVYTYNAATDEYVANTLNSDANVRREYIKTQDVLFNASISYDNDFGKHHVAGMFLYEVEKEDGDNFYARRYLAFDLDELFAGNALDQEANMNTDALYEYASRAFIGRLNYDYAGKYLLEFSCRYDMSSRFASSKRGGFFPGGSIGYRISEENFWKNSQFLRNINNMKIRASYGVMGRDDSLNFQFLTGYTYPSSGYMFDGNFVNGITDTGLANKDISWEKCYTFDVGLDIEIWNGLLGYTVDYFNRLRTGMFATRYNSLPLTTGAELPQENLNSERTTGYDMSVSHHNHKGDFYYSINANLSFAFNKALYREMARAGNSYENWKSNASYRNTGLWWGYGAAGRFMDWDSIQYSDTYVGYGTLPGDFIYEDWNEDGYISSLDSHVIGYSGSPQIYYGLTFEMKWKNLDFNLLLQGSGRHWVYYSEILGVSLWGGGNSPYYFYDRWHPEDPYADPFDPSTKWVQGRYAFGGQSADENSEFRIMNAAYLRVKSVEIGYTLPEKLTKKAFINSLRLYVNSYNPLTFSKIKGLDPEHTNDNSGYIYPINTTINIGLQLKF